MNDGNTLLHCELIDLVLLDPIKQGAENLKIISGYATNTMASWHIKKIAEAKDSLNPINITLIVGMCGFDGISQAVHEGFKSIASRKNEQKQSKFNCQYVIEGAPVHTKLYLWERKGVPFRAFMGSANYTQTAFSRLRRELMRECDPVQALKYYNELERDTMHCNHSEIEDKILITPTHPILEAEEAPLVSIQGSGVESVTLTLLSRNGETGTRSGLNWGQRTGREPNQAYIPLSAPIMRSGFFPLIGNRSGKDNPHFSVLTDDGINFVLRVEQENNKAITTPHNNSQIGEYFRGRIGVANGAYVWRRDLENYGRTNVTFYKLDDEQYYMDFSV